MSGEVRGDAPSLRESPSIENPRFAAERAAGKTCFEIADIGGCMICWGKGCWLAITDGDWSRMGLRAPGTPTRCGSCRGSGLAPRSPSNRKDGSSQQTSTDHSQ